MHCMTAIHAKTNENWRKRFLGRVCFFPRAAHVHADPIANVKWQVVIYDDDFKVLSSPMTLSRVFLFSFRSKTIWPTMLEHSGCALLLSWATCLPVVLSWIAQTTMISPELALRLCFFIKYLALSLCSFPHPPGFFCAFFFSAAGFFCCCNFFCPYICCSIMASCKPKIAKNSCTQAVSWDTETNSIRVCRRKLIIAECASHLLHCFKTYTCKQLSIGQTVNSCKQILICHPCVLDKWRLWSDGSLRHRISAMWPRANLRKTAKVFLFQIKPVQSWHCFVPIFMCKVCWTLGFWIDTDAWQETAGSSETFSSFEGGSPPVQPHEMTHNRKTFNIVWNHGHTCIHRSQFAACTTIFLSRAGLTGRPKSQPPYLEEIAWFSGATVMELPAQDKASRTDFLMSRRMAIKAANKHAYPENLRESSDCQTGAQWTLDPGRLRMFPWFPLLSSQLMAHHPKKMPTGFKWDSMPHALPISSSTKGCMVSKRSRIPGSAATQADHAPSFIESRAFLQVLRVNLQFERIFCYKFKICTTCLQLQVVWAAEVLHQRFEVINDQPNHTIRFSVT